MAERQAETAGEPAPRVVGVTPTRPGPAPVVRLTGAGIDQRLATIRPTRPRPPVARAADRPTAADEETGLAPAATADGEFVPTRLVATPATVRPVTRLPVLPIPQRRPVALAVDEAAIQGAIGRAIAARRTAVGMTQTTLAILVGCDRSAVCRWETGQRAPSLGHLVAIGRALGCGAAALLDEGGEGGEGGRGGTEKGWGSASGAGKQGVSAARATRRDRVQGSPSRSSQPPSPPVPPSSQEGG